MRVGARGVPTQGQQYSARDFVGVYLKRSPELLRIAGSSAISAAYVPLDLAQPPIGLPPSWTVAVHGLS